MISVWHQQTNNHGILQLASILQVWFRDLRTQVQLIDRPSVIFTTHFILAMIQHPEVLAKCQQEIDSVVGNRRLPNFGDRPNLPYLECVMNECLRWAAPLPLSTFVSILWNTGAEPPNLRFTPSSHGRRRL